MKLLMRFLAILLFLPALVWAQSKNNYNYTLDLTKVEDDKVYVELTPPVIKESEITFYFPKMIPGTYAIEDYGRFVSKLEVLDKKGKKLSVSKVDDNSWKIKDANKAAKITYWIEDTFDTKLKGPEVFWPAGTNIEEGKNFLINSSGFFGYFDGYKDKPFTLNVIRAENFYGSTGLIAVKTGEPLAKVTKEEKDNSAGKRVDIFQTENYDRLVDSPIMYSEPDTAIIYVGNTEVLIGSYSPTKKITAKEIAANVREVLMAQKEYLGGKLPVDKYAFVFYFTDRPVTSYGALEHSYSSIYYMPEATIGEMQQQLRDFAAHEFFHIVTPLTIHSEEIGSFGFNNPKMSRHLWLYEGLTEYFAGNVQVKYNLISPEEYLQILQEKMFTAEGFKDNLPFTELSLGALDKYADQYYNVYQKGTLISMCLDINLRKLSNGKYGMQNLVADLGKKYGVSKSFKDEELFAEITKMTYPEIGEFLNTYVAGSASLPLKETFDLVGVEYEREKVTSEYTLGLEQAAITISQYEGKPKLAIGNEDAVNGQGKALGFKNGDIILKINGEEVPDLGPEVGAFIQAQQQKLGEGKTISYTVVRKKDVVELSSPCILAERTRKHLLRFKESPTNEQLAVRKAWLQP
jgi:predicted metalloprotease with PDZ domain